jgi:hypothetical protein
MIGLRPIYEFRCAKLWRETQYEGTCSVEL